MLTGPHCGSRGGIDRWVATSTNIHDDVFFEDAHPGPWCSRELCLLFERTCAGDPTLDAHPEFSEGHLPVSQDTKYEALIAPTQHHHGLIGGLATSIAIVCQPAYLVFGAVSKRKRAQRITTYHQSYA